jgi:L-asparaginase
MNSNGDNDTAPILMIHGGAGRFSRDRERNKAIRDVLEQIRDELYRALTKGAEATEIVQRACQRLETSPYFNAGKGSKVQGDGKIRMSASMMNGDNQAFSGTINVEDIEHPIDLAKNLQSRDDRILDSYGSQRLARELELQLFDPMTKPRFDSWIRERKKQFQNEASDANRGGTIGAVALDQSGALAAGTSTGGKGFEYPGRVSDSAMPAGNYADNHCAISCTGTGEDIVDECFGPRVAIRTKDFGTLSTAIRHSFDEAAQRDRSFGAIAVSASGELWWGKTTEKLLGAYKSSSGAATTLDYPGESLIANHRQAIELGS